MQASTSIEGKESSNVSDLVENYLKGTPNNGISLRALKAYFKFISREGYC